MWKVVRIKKKRVTELLTVGPPLENKTCLHNSACNWAIFQSSESLLNFQECSVFHTGFTGGEQYSELWAMVTIFTPLWTKEKMVQTFRSRRRVVSSRSTRPALSRELSATRRPSAVTFAFQRSDYQAGGIWCDACGWLTFLAESMKVRQLPLYRAFYTCGNSTHFTCMARKFHNNRQNKWMS